MVVLLSIALKSTLVLALGALAARRLRSAPASLRHAVWAVTFAVLLFLPALGVAGPVWAVGMLPSEAVTAEVVPTVLVPATDLGRVSVDAAAVRSGKASTARVAMWLLSLWALGAALVAFVWLRAVVFARRLIRHADPVESEDWTMLLARTSRRSGLRQPVRLLQSSSLRVPIAWGLGRHAIVLPPQCNSWDAERREAVLLHEMAHLRRRDAWTQAMAQAALAVHWLNPLAWLAYRQLANAREEACDDAVLQIGTAPASYASHLVAIAREMKAPHLTLAAVSELVRRDELETRVRSILDDRRQRGTASRWAMGAALGLAVVVGGPLAAFQPVAMQAAEPTLEAEQVASSMETARASEVAVRAPEVAGSGARDQEEAALEPPGSDRQPAPDLPEPLSAAVSPVLPDTTGRQNNDTAPAPPPGAQTDTPIVSRRAGGATITTRYGDAPPTLPEGAVAMTTTFDRPPGVDRQTHDAIVEQILNDITAEIITELGAEVTPARFSALYTQHAEGIPDRYSALLNSPAEHGQPPAYQQ